MHEPACKQITIILLCIFVHFMKRKTNTAPLFALTKNFARQKRAKKQQLHDILQIYMYCSCNPKNIAYIFIGS